MNNNEIKLKIKNWSDEFETKFNHPPKGKDILTAPKEIRELYKIYKTQKNSSSIQNETVNPWDVRTKIITPITVKETEINVKSFDEIVKNNTRNFRENLKNKNKLNKLNSHEKENCQSNPDSKPTENIQSNLFKIPMGNVANTTNHAYTTKTNFSPNLSIDAKPIQQAEHISDAKIPTHTTETKYNNPELFNKNNAHSEIASISRDFTDFSNPKPKIDTACLSKIATEISENSVFSLNHRAKRKLSPSDGSPPPRAFKKQSFIERSTHINIERYLNEPDHHSEPPIDQSHLTATAAIPKRTPIHKAPQIPIPISEKPTRRISNQNFLKLNLKFRGYCPKATAKQRFTRNQIHRTKWNNKMRGTGKCFRCGEEGHYSNKCPVRPTFGPRDEKSYQNALGFTDKSSPIKISDFRFQNLDTLASQIGRENLLLDKPPQSNPNISQPIHTDDIDECVSKTLKLFGFSAFRADQQSIIRRICAGKSTLAILPTGSGKSLCYQIPAYIYQQTRGTVAIIVSPLISLMQDQISKLPNGVKGAVLNSTLKPEARTKLLQEIAALQYAFILLSPEALVDCNWLSADKLPPISFACIDEVHCLSDWSHHFRPSYLRVCRLLRDAFRVRCFLGLSATCSGSTTAAVLKSLYIDCSVDRDAIVQQCPLPSNISISVTTVSDKCEAIAKLLSQPPLSCSASVLIYCASRDETVRLAAFLEDRLQRLRDRLAAEGAKAKLAGWWTASAYHAGMTAPERTRTQRAFMRGRTRVLVATIAFGMGLDKSDLRAVVHYSRPRSFENFVQEVGRAGRDGLPAAALVLLSRHASADTDTAEHIEERNELHRHTFGNHLDAITVKRFVERVFLVERRCGSDFGSDAIACCSGHIGGFAPSQLAVELNVREETLMTLLCYLELYRYGGSDSNEGERCFRLLPANYRFCRLSCYRGPHQMAALSRRSLPVSAAISLDNRSIEKMVNCRSIEIDMLALWDRFGFDVATMRKELKSMEWNSVVDEDGKARFVSSGVDNDWSQWTWMFAMACDIDSEELGRVVEYLEGRLNDLERCTIDDVDRLHTVLMSNCTEFSKLFSETEDGEAENEEDNGCWKAKSERIRGEIVEYFRGEQKRTNESNRPRHVYAKTLEIEARSHIRAFVAQFVDENKMSGRAVASVMHGIDCPMFPAMYFASQKTFWKSLLAVDFITIMNWANEEMRFLL